MVHLVMKIIGGFFSAFAWDYWVIAVARFVLGAGSIGVYLVAFVLSMYVVP